MIKLYHGSNVIIETISLKKSKPFKDFGRAFYLSDAKSQEEELAKMKAKIFGGEPTLNIFEFDENFLNTNASNPLRVKIFPHYSLEWAEFVWNNRDINQRFEHQWDIVYGPIANDTVGFQMRLYREQHRSLKEFLEGLKYSKGETFQYAFCTERSLNYLTKL